MHNQWSFNRNSGDPMFPLCTSPPLEGLWEVFYMAFNGDYSDILLFRLCADFVEFLSRPKAVLSTILIIAKCKLFCLFLWKNVRKTVYFCLLTLSSNALNPNE